MYLCHKNATLQTLVHLLHWSPDFIFDIKSMSNIISHNNYDIMVYLFERYSSSLSGDGLFPSSSLVTAVIFEIACWLHVRCPNREWDEPTLDQSIDTGRVELVKWLHNNRPNIKCPNSAMNKAIVEI
ncbi:hypothetical protein DFA_02092 [Cavenderia fasciculata]|uniref:Uncharacterized protein n=1 Tax=Cavenderia fasciculata TaxID=261658 RepID=F4PYN9_CACFS|nr:uncharacterized protein DFA_02092 [Cavenderia fasciculata]EGG19305.1 hypothetical protein DFA_02092 [Cavenderia fasciculata]|eukprot:XP_004357576.1 hypothetical protein DFA_02092 [Cavenderia fasciculata]